MPNGFVPFSALAHTVETGDLGFAKVEVSTTRFLSANPRFCAMVGYQLDELLEQGVTVRDLTHPDDFDRCKRELLRLLSGEIDSYTIEKRYIMKGRSVLPVRATVTALERFGDGRITTVGVISVPSDLGFGEGPQRAVPPRVTSFWTRDLVNDTGTCSNGLKILFGLPADGPPPTFTQCVAMIHPEDRPRVLEDVERVARGMVQTSEFRIFHPTGEMRWVSQSTKPTFNAAGDVVGMIGNCLDISDVKRPLKDWSSANTVKIVKSYVDLHWDQKLNVGALAEAAKVNTRTLFRHCKLAWGFTPYEYIKRVRLNHARAMLEMANSSTTVLGTALKCCFQNQGHFARDYRLAFGERPSQTLDRARATLRSCTAGANLNTR